MFLYNGEKTVHLTVSVDRNLILVTAVNLSRTTIPSLHIHFFFSSTVEIIPVENKIVLPPGLIYQDCFLIHHAEQSMIGFCQAQWLDAENDLQIVVCPVKIVPCYSSTLSQPEFWENGKKFLKRTEISISAEKPLSQMDLLQKLTEFFHTPFHALIHQKSPMLVGYNPVMIMEVYDSNVILWTANLPPHQTSWQECFDRLLRATDPTSSSKFFEIGRLVTTLSDYVEIDAAPSYIQSKYAQLRKNLASTAFMDIPSWGFMDPLTGQDKTTLQGLLTQIETFFSF